MAGCTLVFSIQPTGFPAQPTGFPTTTKQAGSADVSHPQLQLFLQLPSKLALQMFLLSNLQSFLICETVITSKHHLLVNLIVYIPKTEITTQASPALEADPSFMNNVQAPLAQKSNPVIFPVAMPTVSGSSAGAAVNDIGKITEVQEQLERSYIKLTESESKLQDSEKKLSLAEQEKTSLGRGRVLYYHIQFNISYFT